MKRRSIALIVGNGLAIDFIQHFEESGKQWNPSRPTEWGRGILGWFPRLSAGLAEVRRNCSTTDDFRDIASAIAGAPDRESQHALHEDAMRFLALCYRHWHFMIQDTVDNVAWWWWTRWLNSHAQEIQFVVSFNYDLLVERALREAGISTYRVGLVQQTGAVPVFKPHGSIDYGTDLLADQTHARDIIFVQCDTPQRLLTDEEMRNRQIAECNIVPPLFYSQMRHLQSVNPGYAAFASIAKTLTHVLLIGLSYCVVDRPEIDELLDGLKPGARVIVVNISPDPELIEAIEQRGLVCEFWDRTPRSIN